MGGAGVKKVLPVTGSHSRKGGAGLAPCWPAGRQEGRPVPAALVGVDGGCLSVSVEYGLDSVPVAFLDTSCRAPDHSEKWVMVSTRQMRQRMSQSIWQAATKMCHTPLHHCHFLVLTLVCHFPLPPQVGLTQVTSEVLWTQPRPGHGGAVASSSLTHWDHLLQGKQPMEKPTGQLTGALLPTAM